MKITTEIIQSIFIITCKGPVLDASLTNVFLTAMTGIIIKNQMDALLDLSAIDFIDTDELESVIHSFKKIGGHSQLTVCGVSYKNLSIRNTVKFSRGQRTNIHYETDRNTALNKFFWDDKEENEVSVSLPCCVDETPRNASRHTDPTNRNSWNTVTKDRRKYRRIDRKQIMDDDFVIYCKNTTKKRHYLATVLNISLGGLLMEARSPISIGDKLLLEGRIGKIFKFKEQAISRSWQKQKRYGLSFTNLSEETAHFLNQLTGSVGVTQANRFSCERSN